MRKEEELEMKFGISRLTDMQELKFKTAVPKEKMIYRLPLYDMLYNQDYRNMFEWNQQIEVQPEYQSPEALALSMDRKNMKDDRMCQINFDKLSTLTMIALNLSYINCPDFNFDQDLYSDDFTFKFDCKKGEKDHGLYSKEQKLAVLFDFDNKIDRQRTQKSTKDQFPLMNNQKTDVRGRTFNFSNKH